MSGFLLMSATIIIVMCVYYPDEINPNGSAKDNDKKNKKEDEENDYAWTIILSILYFLISLSFQ